MLQLSVLDQSTITTGRGPGPAIRETLGMAQLADRLGYHRYWLAEHHNSHSHAGSAPEILAAAIAATTHRIRVGTAGVMLPHYASLKVAEQFRVLEALAPGRIDLGLGRAPGSDGLTARALNPNASAAERFPQQVQEILGWVGDGLPDNHPFGAITAQPEVETRPNLWILGSSDYGAQVAAYFGLPYCFAHFITDGAGCAEAMAAYRSNFRPHPDHPGRLDAPYAALGVMALAAPTQAEAERLFAPRALWRLGRDRGIFRPLASVEEAEAHAYTPQEQHYVEHLRAEALIGTPEVVREKLENLAESMGAQEIAVLTPCYDSADRQASYRLLAEAFGLKPAA